MRKLGMMLLVMLCLIATLAISASAVTNEGNHWVENAPKIQEILAGKAGEETTAWEVPYLAIKPTLDGQITKNEYYPFDMYEDYLSYMAIDTNNTQEDFQRFYEMTKYDFFDAYWGWDGEYMYIAFEVECPNGFKCTPEEMGSTSYLYAYNMLQIGISHKDATGKSPGYVELGYGVHSETGESLAHAWAGSYYPVGGEDFVGSYSQENQVVVYEVRVHLQKALGLKDTTVQNGDQINYAWLLSVNGETSSTNDYWQVGFCHGIGGQYSYKANEYMALITFTGLPDDVEIKPEELPGVSEEDLAFGLVESVDMSDEKVVNTFLSEDAVVEYVTENDESFMRITGFSQGGYVYSSKFPRNLQSADCEYIVVKYRTSSPKASDLGILYRSADYPTYDLEDVYVEPIGTDGEWHIVIFYMTSTPTWINWIVNVGLFPFAEAEDPAGETLDIAYIKFYTQDPWDLFEDQLYFEEDQTEANAVEQTQAETQATWEDTNPQDTTPMVDDTMTVTVDDTQRTDETSGDTVTSSGCASVMSVGLLVVCALGFVAVTYKKKENI